MSMRNDPERFVSFVLGSFAFAWYMALGVKIAGVWRRIGRCPIPAFTVGGTRNRVHAAAALLGPLVLLAWSYDPARFAWLPRATALETLPVRLAGLLLLCTGASVLVAAAADLGDAWRMGVEPGQPIRLVSSGIYGAIRHPMYAGIILALAGIFLLAPNALFGLVLLAGAPAALAQARHEDAFLAAALPDEFPGYAARTGLLWPR